MPSSDGDGGGQATAPVSRRSALYRVATFDPRLTAVICLFSVIAAALEGLGLSFILPIVELAQGTMDPQEATGLLGVFVSIYTRLGVSLTLGTLVLGATIVMTVRYTSSFTVEWLRATLEKNYVRHLQQQGFSGSLSAEMSYFDREGTDELLNTLVKQTEYGGRVIKYGVRVVKSGFIVTAYLAIALYMSVELTIVSVVCLGLLVLLFRFVIEPGESLGNEVADANEDVQWAAQSGTRGVNEVKTFGLREEFERVFDDAVTRYTRASVKLTRNEAAISEFYNLATAVTIFFLIFVALTFLTLPLGRLGVFLFAMFRLGPTVSGLSSVIYKTEGKLPHLVRTLEFVDRLEAVDEEIGSGDRVPDRVEQIRFENVGFRYHPDDERVLDDVSFHFGRSEFVAFVGPSGAGKSTIASLLTRLYRPDRGRILANDVPLEEFDLEAWRSRVSVVRQNPYIFDDTLRRNVTIGFREASDEAVEQACRIARVDEFVDELPQGYETVLGDEGVRLSGGQRQRVALARALLKDSDVLVLDEATSDLDSALEQEVHTAIAQMDREYAIVAIAHRLSTVVNADRIYTLVDGEITEVGGHQELLDRGGTYATLHQIQSSTG